MREKHMGISARLNFFWASMDVLVGRCLHVHSMQLYKYTHGWLAAATHYWRPNGKQCNILTLQFFGRRRMERPRLSLLDRRDARLDERRVTG
jgi:hypothetical protein